jgi:hypothetical protein
MSIEELESMITEDVGRVAANGSYSGAITNSLISIAKRFAISQLEKIECRSHDTFGTPDGAYVDEGIEYYDQAMREVREQKKVIIKALQ